MRSPWSHRHVTRRTHLDGLRRGVHSCDDRPRLACPCILIRGKKLACQASRPAVSANTAHTEARAACTRYKRRPLVVCCRAEGPLMRLSRCRPPLEKEGVAGEQEDQSAACYEGDQVADSSPRQWPRHDRSVLKGQTRRQDRLVSI